MSSPPADPPVYDMCTCGCGCEPDGDWHWSQRPWCPCISQGCPCVTDANIQEENT